MATDQSWPFIPVPPGWVALYWDKDLKVSLKKPVLGWFCGPTKAMPAVMVNGELIVARDLEIIHSGNIEFDSVAVDRED